MRKHPAFLYVAIAFGVIALTSGAYLGTAAAAATTYYVSPDGNDAANGGQDAPLQTLAHAQTLVRQDITAGLNAPVDVILEAGTYYLASPLTFTAADSGTAAFPVTWEAASGTTVIISGGKAVSSWTQNGSLWQASVTPGSAFRTLRVGDSLATRVRYPKADPTHPYTAGYLIAQNETFDPSNPCYGTSTSSYTCISFNDGDIPVWSSTAGAEVHVFSASNWASGIVPIDHIDYGSHLIYLTTPLPVSPGGMQQGNRYYIENVDSDDMQPGEWSLNAAGDQLSYYPQPSDNFGSSSSAVGATLTTLINLTGTSNAPTQYLNFKGLQFSDANYTLQTSYYNLNNGALTLNNADHIGITDDHFTDLGGGGIFMLNDSDNNLMSGTTIDHVGEDGVLMYGNSLAQPSHNLFIGNTINHIGSNYDGGAGIAMNSGDGNRISYNTITDMPRYAVSMSSLADTTSGSTTIHYRSNNNIVEYNDIERTNLNSRDTGAIALLGRDRLDDNNVIRYNRILDTVGLDTDTSGTIITPELAWGIYLDDMASGTTIYGNVIARANSGAVFIHGSQDTDIENNVFVDSGNEQFWMQQSRDDFAMQNNTIAHNIFSWQNLPASTADSENGASSYLLWTLSFTGVTANQPDGIKTWDYNLYNLRNADYASFPAFNGVPRNTHSNGWFIDYPTWQGTFGMDAHSTSGDPLFTDAGSDNYALQSGSPAFGLGFKSLPANGQIGAAYWLASQDLPAVATLPSAIPSPNAEPAELPDTGDDVLALAAGLTAMLVPGVIIISRRRRHTH